MVSQQPAQPPLVVPSDWTRLATSEHGDWKWVTHAYVEPLAETSTGVVPSSLTITAADNDGQSFGQWQRTTEDVLPQLFDDYLAIDAQRIEIAGAPGGRRLAHYRAADGGPRTMEQWFVALDGVGHTLTFTVDTRHYDAVADDLAESAATWRPDGGQVR